jgi:hypothetical protein
MMWIPLDVLMQVAECDNYHKKTYMFMEVKLFNKNVDKFTVYFTNKTC